MEVLNPLFGNLHSSPMDSKFERPDRLSPRNPTTEAIMRAAQRRNPTAVAVPGRTPRVSKNKEFEPWDVDHPVRQEFRRLLDPGILGRNNKKDAAASIRARHSNDV